MRMSHFLEWMLQRNQVVQIINLDGCCYGMKYSAAFATNGGLVVSNFKCVLL